MDEGGQERDEGRVGERWRTKKGWERDEGRTKGGWERDKERVGEG